MSALLDSLLAGREDAAAAAIRAHGLPGARSEAWKYTSLRALERRRFSPPAAAKADPALLADIPEPRLVFVNGDLDAGLSSLGQLPEGVHLERLVTTTPDLPDAPAGTPWQSPADDVFLHLNTLLATGGVQLRVEGDIDSPLHLVCLNLTAGSDHASHLRHRLRLQAGARLTLVQHQLGEEGCAAFDNSVFEIALEENAELHHYRVEASALATTCFARTRARLAAGSHYQRLDMELGAALSRHVLEVRLEGEGANFSGSGILLADGRRQLDTRLNIRHAAANTHCQLPWRGLATGRARLSFHGGIHIEAGADGSEADLQNRNLLLDEDAQINTQPVLVIHADEVKAAHGATVGQLDANALFYLRARGIPEAEARRILTAAFCRDLLRQVEDPGLHALLENRLDAALARMQAA